MRHVRMAARRARKASRSMEAAEEDSFAAGAAPAGDSLAAEPCSPCCDAGTEVLVAVVDRPKRARIASNRLIEERLDEEEVDDDDDALGSAGLVSGSAGAAPSRPFSFPYSSS